MDKNEKTSSRMQWLVAVLCVCCGLLVYATIRQGMQLAEMQTAVNQLKASEFLEETVFWRYQLGGDRTRHDRDAD